MVGRFVEDQPVRLLEQRARQQGARALAPGELIHRAVEIALGEGKAVERRAHLPLVRGAAFERFLEGRPQRGRSALGRILREIAEARLACASNRSVVLLIDAREQPD